MTVNCCVDNTFTSQRLTSDSLCKYPLSCCAVGRTSRFLTPLT